MWGWIEDTNLAVFSNNPRTSPRKKGEKERASRLGYRCPLPKLMLFSLTRVQRGHHEHAGYDTGKALAYCGLSYDGLPAGSHSVSVQPSHLPLEVTLEFQVGLISVCWTPFSSFFSNLEATSSYLTLSQQACSGKCHSLPPPMTIALTACSCLNVHTPLSIKMK